MTSQHASIDGAAFGSAVRWAARALPVRPTVPVTAGIVLESGSGILTASAFDYHVQAGAAAHSSGDLDAVIVSGRMLADIAGRLTGDVKLEYHGASGGLTIRAGRDRFRLPVMPSHDYPAVPALPDPDGTAPGFADAVTRAEVAAGRDLAKPGLMTIELTAGDGQLRLAATDSYRAAVEFVPWDGRDAGPVLVPAKRLKEIAKEAGDKPSLGFGDSALSITSGQQAAGIGYVAAEFPQVMKLIETHTVKSSGAAQTDRADLMRAVSASSLFASQSQPVRLDVAAGSLTAWAQDDGDGELVVEARYDGEPRRFALQPAFLLDALTATAGPIVQLRFPPGSSGAVFVDSVAEYGAVPDPSHHHVVMTVRIPQEA